jgi:chemotaxis protein MotB
MDGQGTKVNPRKIRKKAGEVHEVDEIKTHSSWAVSYADTVTLLLCFFIMFFNVDPKKENSPKRDLFLLSISDQFQKLSSPRGTASQNSLSANDGRSQTPKEPVVERSLAAKFDKVFSQFGNFPNARVVGGSDSLGLEITNVEFFRKGSVKLTPEGLKNVEMVFKVIEPYTKMVVVEIIGHSDSVPVSSSLSANGKRNFTSNLELSTLRAMEVLGYFKRLGLSEENMVISGYSDTKLIEVDGVVLAANSNQRRVSFRIRLK